MAVGVGQRCLVRVKITDVELRNARDIVATVVSPHGDEKCEDVAFDELEGLVYVSVDVNSAGAYSMWLEVRFVGEVVYTPAFVFAEVEGEATPCDAPYIVDVEVAGESVTVTPPKVDVDGEGGASITIDTELSETSDNAIANSAVAKALKDKQNLLSLTTKPNGNIVIGNLAGQTKEFMPATPSGDPMHYAYETEGAVYNNSDAPLEVVDWFGKTITHEPHKWYLNGLGDLSNEEMAKIYSLGRFSPSIQSPLGYGSNSYPDYATTVRTNIARLGMYNGIVSTSYFASTNYVIETINASIASKNPRGNTTINSYYAFNNCQKLRSIYGVIKLNGDATTTFAKCYQLRDVKISDLNVNTSLADSPLISKESLLYMINNCASGVSFTITLHPDVYYKCSDNDDGLGEWFSEFDQLLGRVYSEKSTEITLAY